jgi:hypothetical protein
VTATDKHYTLSDGHGQFFSTGAGRETATSGGCGARDAG